MFLAHKEQIKNEKDRELKNEKDKSKNQIFIMNQFYVGCIAIIEIYVI